MSFDRRFEGEVSDSTHPQAQKGDKIFKTVGCSQLVVLRGIPKGYCVVGDAFLSDMYFDGSEKERLHIL